VTGAVRDAIGAGRQLEADRADLLRRRDLLPTDGYTRLWNEAHRDAKLKLDEAQGAANRAYSRLETALQDATLPKFDPSREQLARDECALALSNGNPEAGALEFASRGNDEAVAALLSPWGKTLLRSRGVQNPEPVLRDVRKIAVGRALDRGETPAAKALKEHFPALGAAKGSAGSQVRGFIGWNHY